MPSLSSVLGSRNLTLSEENIETGRVLTWSHGSNYSGIFAPICWIAPSNGIATIEVWGAGGSSSLMCCCGFSLPGNSGGYARKTVTLATGNFVCGSVGRACNNGGTLCDRGCSEASGVCWNGTSAGCMCAQGGRGGVAICSTSAGGYCCFVASGYCHTNTGSGCGIICNFPVWCARGFGGDVNCCGGISCVNFCRSSPECSPAWGLQTIAVPPGFISTGGGFIQFIASEATGFSSWSGNGRHQAIAAISSMSRVPGGGIPPAACWNSNSGCGCYESWSCVRGMPIGVGAPMATPCSGVRDHGHTGGDGAIRIRFTPT